MPRATKAKRTEATAYLTQLLPVNSYVYGVWRSPSKGSRVRRLDLLAYSSASGDFYAVTEAAAILLGLPLTTDKKRSLRITGRSQHEAFAILATLSQKLFGTPNKLKLRIL